MPRVLTPDPAPKAVADLLEHRRRAGADTHDEMWDGVLHMAPAPRDVHAVLAHQLGVLLDPLARAAGLMPSAEFNLGTADDYRVPDLGLHRDPSWGTYAPTAALVVEILSPGDETWDKLPFYNTHGVEELIVVDPDRHAVTWFVPPYAGGAYGEVKRSTRSTLLGLSADELAAQLDWPS